jgi:hypothetical protein
MPRERASILSIYKLGDAIASITTPPNINTVLRYLPLLNSNQFQAAVAM